MEKFIGVKLINAKPMNRLEYNQFRGWQLPENENGADDGYLVEYIDGGKANTPEYAGYVSWSPKDVFDRAYQATNGMTFGFALEAIKAGNRAARAGWNGKGMWVCLGAGATDVSADQFWNVHTRAFAESNGGSANVQPYLIMKNAQGFIQMGWAPTQSDLLADDWRLV